MDISNTVTNTANFSAITGSGYIITANTGVVDELDTGRISTGQARDL